MYDPDDIARSVRRYVAEMLGPPWALGLERKEVKDEARPAGSVELGAVSVRRSRSTIPQGEVSRFMPVTVTLYPGLAAPREAGRTARMLAHGLERLISSGAEGPIFASGRPASGPERIPLYDYSPVPLEGSTAEREGPALPHDVLWAEDYSTRAVQDSQDPRRWTVVLELRVSWEAPGRIGPDAPIAVAMPGGWVPPP